MKTYDPLAEYLRSRDCPAHVVRAGFKGLVLSWEKVVHELVFDGYRFGLRDFVNDMDRREILNGAMQQMAGDVPPALATRVAAADQRFRDATLLASRCLLDEETLAARNPDRERDFWYYRLPKRRRGFIVKEMDEAGISTSEP